MTTRDTSQTAAPAPVGAVPSSLPLPPVAGTEGLDGHAGGHRPPQGDDGAPRSPRTWRIELPAGLKVLNLNDSLHWAEVHRRRQSLKKAAWVMALNAKIPHLTQGTVQLEYQPPDLRQRDEDNMAATAKPCIDGLVAAKVFNNDSSKYVSYGGCTISKIPYPKGRVTIIITEGAQ